MQAKTKIKFLAGLCAVALSLGIAVPRAQAQDTSAATPPAATAVEPSAAAAKPAVPATAAKRYYVEFRSRSALSYGHTFLVHGKLNARGEVGQVTVNQVAGLHPATESSIPWMIGHLIPVVSETGASDGDTEDEYITARYRVLFTEAEYAKVSAYIKSHQKNSPLWHAVLYNCNAWVADVAKFMGLKTPDSTMLYPEDYIGTLAKLNGSVAKPGPGQKKLPPRPATAANPAAPKPAAATTGAKPAAPRQTAAAPVAAPSEENVRY